MDPRYFVDENDLALGRTLAELHEGVVFPGHPEIEVQRGALDDEWLPVIGSRKLLVITRDKRIRYRPVEKQLWVKHGVRGFVLTGRGSQSTKDSMEILDSNWARIEEVAIARPEGPWMMSATTTGLRELKLN